VANFTNTWDNSQPPDSQAANQLGLDLRTFRVDAQERTAYVSGLDANKPANWEAGFAGVLYHASDTGIIYQWSGVGWTQVGTFLATALSQITIPGGSVSAPGLKFSPGGTDTGIYSSSTGLLEFAIAGAKYLGLDASALVRFFKQPNIDSSVAALAQTDNSQSLPPTKWLRDAAASGLQYSVASGSGFLALPKWLGNGTNQFVIKWAIVTPSSDNFTINYDTTVPFGATACATYTSTASDDFADTFTATGFNVHRCSGETVSYIAVGHS